MKSVNKRLLLSTSESGDVVIAEVAQRYQKDPRFNEYYVSRSTLTKNVESGNFTEVSDKVEWDGRIWMLSSDMVQ
jgi:hypothetical protein